MHDENESPISFKVVVSRLPQKGMPVSIEADPVQREKLAAGHDLVSVERLEAHLLVAPWNRNGVRVSGHFHADITQQCVVTLEPLHAGLEDEVDGVFLPANSKLGRLGFAGEGEILIDVDGPDSPETFTGDAIDVGALVEEFFGLSIDPYPRKPGAEFGDAREADPAGQLQEKLRILTRKT